MIEQTKNEIILIKKLLVRLLDKYETKSLISFGNIFETVNGGTFQSKYYVEKSKNKLITIKNVDDNGFNTNFVSYLDDVHADKKYLLNEGDIVLTMTGNIGRTGIVDENNCYLNQRVLKIRSLSNSYLLAYLAKYKNEIILLGKGTAQQNLSLDDLKGLIIFNNEQEIKEFKKYDVIFESIVNRKLILKKLIKIKSLLLLKYF